VGDRSNVFFQEVNRDGKWIGLGLYSHWGGREAQQVVIDAAILSRPRLSDPSYFIRRTVQIALQRMDPEASEGGHGLWVAMPDDNEYPILVINAMTGLTWLADEHSYREDAPDGAVHVSEFVLG
jgi:hypothetical protein